MFYTIHEFYRSAVYFFKISRLLELLTLPQRKIVGIAKAAFGRLAASYKNYRYGSMQKNVVPIDLKNPAAQAPAQVNNVYLNELDPFRNPPILPPTVILIEGPNESPAPFPPSVEDNINMEPQSSPEAIEEAPTATQNEKVIIVYQNPATQGAIVPAQPAASDGYLQWAQSLTIQVTNSLRNACGTLYEYGKTALSAVNEANNLRIELKNGVDLCPIFIKAYDQSRLGTEALTAYWNAPGAEYDPLTANLMEGFAQTFGPRLHYMLLNAVRLGLPEFAGQVAVNLNITTSQGLQLIDNYFLKFSNPIGWINIMTSFTNMGIAATDVINAGMLGKLDASIDNYTINLAKNRGLDPQYMEFLLLGNIKTQAYIVYKEELDRFVAQLEAEGLKPAGASLEGSGVLKYIWYGLDVAYELIRPWYRQFEASKAPESYRKAKRDYGNICKAIDSFRPKIKEQSAAEMLRYKPLLDLAIILKNSAKKTLVHLTQDLEGKIESLEQSDVRKSAMKSTLSTLMLGYQSKALTVGLKKIKGVQPHVEDMTDAQRGLKLLADSPLSTIYGALPDFITERPKHLLATFNRGVGRHVGVAVSATFDESAVNYLGLKNLKIFEAGYLKFNLKKTIQRADTLNPQLKQSLLTVLNVTGELLDLNLDAELQKIIRRAGGIVADMIAEQLAMELAKRLNSKYTHKELMTQEIELGWLAKASRKTAVFAGGVIGSGLESVYAMYQVTQNPFPTDF